MSVRVPPMRGFFTRYFMFYVKKKKKLLQIHVVNILQNVFFLVNKNEKKNFNFRTFIRMKI